jgi:Flp pilus assembly protein TadG
MRRFCAHGVRRFAGDQRGTAAVEMGLIAPFLIAIVVGMVTLAPLMWTKQSMHVAVNSGAQYVMDGSSNTTNIQSVTLDAWSHRPADGAVAVSLFCSCAGVTTACTTLCGSTAPPRYISITATTTFHGVSGNQALSSTQVVRTR